MAHLFHGLPEGAFDGAVDPRAPVLSAGAKAALAELEEGLARGDAVLTLSGEPGLGKTTLARVLAARAAPAGVRTVFVHHPQLAFEDLLRLIADEIGVVQPGPRAPFERLRAVQRRLVEALARGGRLLVVVDEAQELPDETLESLRLLATLEAGPRARPLQLLLVGQPELEARLRRRAFRALAQRVGTCARLEPMAPGEARAWVLARMAQARPQGAAGVFTAPALDALARRGGGAPRTMERLARRALGEAGARRERPVRRATVVRAAAELAPRGPGLGRAWPGIAAAGVALAGVLALGAGWRAQEDARVQVARAKAEAQAALAQAGRPADPLRAAVALDAAQPDAPVADPPSGLRPPLR